MTRRYKEKEIIEALEACAGMVYVAARRLGCSAPTIYSHIRKSDKVREVHERSRGEHVDEAELSLRRGVRDGQPWAVCFTLKTLGKSRGYVERQEHTGADGGPIQLEGKGLSSLLMDDERS